MNIIDYKPALICFIIAFILTGYGFENPASCREKSIIIIEVRENQGIRDISRKYFNDPDRWEDVLRANDLKSPDEIKPGMLLRIPAGVFFQAKRELEVSGRIIQQATRAGAKIFTPEIITNAIHLRDTAILKQKAGDLSACITFAKSAAKQGKKALKICAANQDVPAEAVVQDRKGHVHSRKPSDNLWKDVSRYDILKEGERIRALSQSYCDILFRNDTRIRLNENSQALIRKMRANLLEDTGEAKVSLVKGDVLALLASGKKNDRFQLDVPGVDTKVNSKFFWVGRDKEGTRFANYDGEIEIASAGSKVVLTKNHGSVVLHNQKPSSPRELISSPMLLKPENGYEGFDINMPLTWEEVKNADYYLLEFSHNVSFSPIIYSKKIETTSVIFPKHLVGGPSHDQVYWRVSAVSSEKLRSRPSEARFVRIILDDKPPFLVIQSPDEGLVLSENMVEISGMTESGITLTIEDQPVEIKGNGKFQFRHELYEGINNIIVKAIDRAGNITELKRSVTFMPGSKIDLTFDPSLHQIRPNHFLVSQRSFALSGKTNPHCFITVSSVSTVVPATANSDDEGRFQVNITITKELQEFIIEIASPSGIVKRDHFTVEIDDKPPIIHLYGEIPSGTTQNKVSVAGIVEDAEKLDLNGKTVSLDDGRFSEEIQLKPGTNSLCVLAADSVGNVARIEKEVLFDPDPPKLLKYEISFHDTEGKNQAKVLVWVEDQSGLVKTAPFTVQIGNSYHTGLMILTGSKGRYVGLFRIPEGAGRPVKLKSVTLSDYLGNSKEYRF